MESQGKYFMLLWYTSRHLSNTLKILNVIKLLYNVGMFSPTAEQLQQFKNSITTFF